MSIVGKIKRLQGKKIALLGLGIENEAMLNWFLKHKLEAEFTICDFRSPEQLGERFDRLSKRKNIQWRLGQEYNKELYDFDMLFRSPGWTTRCPGIVEAKRTKGDGIEVTSAMNLFLELCPTRNTIGVTGTKGKGTTSSMVYAIIKAAKKTVHLGGNIGVAPFVFMDKLAADDWVVLELSSFQLEDMVHSPKIAVITNFSKEHLQPADPNNPNYHPTLKSYWNAKANIWRHAENRCLVANRKLESRITIQESGELIAAKKLVYFGKSVLETILPGDHNLENIAAAEEVARIIKIPAATVAAAIKKFKGLEHRIEKVGTWDRVSYYDDSFATIPDATITALRSFSVPVVVLLGGADKGADFRKLASEVKRRCNFAVLLKGDATPRIAQALMAAGFAEKQMREVDDIGKAVAVAAEKAARPGVVLLSTACASFGMFRNYKQRGQLFKQAVSDLFGKPHKAR